MTKKKADVRSGGKIVSSVEYDIFDSIEEARQILGEEKTLEYINSLSKTNAQNLERSQFNKKPTKAWFREQAGKILNTLSSQEVQSIIASNLNEWIEQNAARLEKEWEASREQRASETQKDVDEQLGQEEDVDTDVPQVDNGTTVDSTQG